MSRDKDITEALDQCLALLEQGRSISACLSRYPEYADALRPLLEAADVVRKVPPPVARAEAVTRGRERMMAALEVKKAARPGRQGLKSFFAFPFFRSTPALLRGAVLVALALSIVVVALLLDVGPLPWRSRWVAAQAVLTDVEGRVLLLHSGSRTWLPAFDGDAIEVGDRVRVDGDDAQARLAFADGSSSELRTDAELAMIQMAASPRDGTANVVYQERGQARYLVLEREAGSRSARRQPIEGVVRSTFEVRTPAAVTRGNSGVFSLSVAPDGATTVKGEEGVFVVTSRETQLMVAAGEMTTVEAPTQSPEPGVAADDRVQLTAGAASGTDEVGPPAEGAAGKDGVGLTGTPPSTGTPETATPESTATETPSATPSVTETPTSTSTPEPPPPTSLPEPAVPQPPPMTDGPPVPTREPEPPDDGDDGNGDDGEWDPPGLEDNPGLEDDDPPGLDDKGDEPPGQGRDKDKGK